MKTKFRYTGIRVKDLDASVAFYTKVLGMKDLERSTVDETKGRSAMLATEDGGFILELNYYEKGSRFATEYAVGEGSTTSRSKSRTLRRRSRKPRERGTPSPST